MAFLHIAEIMEGNARPFRVSEGDEDMTYKQARLNENELAYYRNKNSQKLEEMQVRYKALFTQLEKQIKKLRSDNIKLIEEFNLLVNEKKKLNDLRRMIKDSLKEFLGETFDQIKHGSSDEEGFKGAGNKKKERKMSQDDGLRSSNGEQSSGKVSRSKSINSFANR